MITKADKGKTIVIIYVHEYNTKVYIKYLTQKKTPTADTQSTD
jgi:phage-related protein